jgi:outer membrane protein assembly factor BamB
MRSRLALACAALAAGPAFAQRCVIPDPAACGAILGGLAGGALAAGGGSSVGASWAQPTAPDVGSGRQALPPAQPTLDRLRLAQEWYAYLPLVNQADGPAIIQVIDTELIVAQTKAGLVVALDARTGAKQWTYKLPSPGAAAYPVAAAGRFVFVVNLATLVCLERLTGQVEFVQSLPGSVTNGPAAAVVPVYGIRDNQAVQIGDRVQVYVTLNGNKLVSYPVPDAGRVAAAVLPPPPTTLPAVVTARRPPPDATLLDSAGNRTPSITALPVVVPPYTLYGRENRLTPSLTILPDITNFSTRNPEFLRNNQRTPSISTLPPSVSRAFELSNLRAKGPELRPNWVFGGSVRLEYEPVVSVAVPGVAGPRVFASTAGPAVTALSADAGRVQFDFRFEEPVAAPAAGPAAVDDLEYAIYPLADGAVLAIDVTHGTADGPAVAWRTVVGGRLNRKPVLTPEAVYVAGDGAGVAKLDLRTGRLLWRTAPLAERLLAVGPEFVFVRDRGGNTLVYPKNAGGDGRLIQPVAQLAAAGYTVPVTNSRTDRLLLAAENGLLVSLRDALPAAIRPTTIAPPAAPVVRPPNPPVLNPDGPPPADPPKADGM